MCILGRLWHVSSLRSQSKNKLTARCSYSKTGHVSSPETRETRGRNLWARERVKAHTKRCREHVTRRNLQHVTQRCSADSSSDVGGELSVTNKLSIGELTIDTTMIVSTATPKSSPASFSDVSSTTLLLPHSYFCLKLRIV